MGVMFVIAAILAVTSVNANLCGPPNPCLTPEDLRCRFPKCVEFNHRRCQFRNETCDSWFPQCRCDDPENFICCPAPQCQELDAMQNPALLGPGAIELTDFPTAVQPAAFGSANPGIAVPAKLGSISGNIKINFPNPFELRTVILTTSPATVSSFSLRIWVGSLSKLIPVTGNFHDLPGHTVVTALRISKIKVNDHNNLILNLNLSIQGCLNPACEEVGGLCLEQLEGNDGRCPAREGDEDNKFVGYIDGTFHDGNDLDCNGKVTSIKCCMPNLPEEYQ